MIPDGPLVAFAQVAPEEAEPALRLALAKEPGETILQKALIRSLMAQRRTAEAQRAIDAQIETCGGDLELRLLAIELAGQGGHWSVALKHCTEAEMIGSAHA